MTISNELKNRMSNDVLELDMEIAEHLGDTIDANFTQMLTTIYSNYLKFTKEAYQDIHNQIWKLAVISAIQIGSDGIQESIEHFLLKNPLRNACWTHVGVIGQVTEIQAKMERILNGKVDDRDSIHDAWCDLYNYCKFAIVCYRNDIIGSIYMSEDIVLK